MTRTTWLLIWRQQRWELAFLLGGSLLLAAAISLVAWQLDATSWGLRTCLTDADLLTGSCQSMIWWNNRLSTFSPVLLLAATVTPFVVGLLLGAPLVSREIEKRTAPLAWSLSLSRTRWLGGRTLPLLVAISIALLLLGQATEALIRAMPPGDISFPHFGMHGPLIAVRGIAVFCIGVLIGLFMGRMLPAILVTGLLITALVLGLYVMRDQLMRAEATWVEADQEADLSGVMIYDSGFTDDASGAHLTFDDAYRQYPEVFGPDGNGQPPGMTPAYLLTPRELYPVFAAREIGALALVIVLAAGLALWVVGWRRPD